MKFSIIFSPDALAQLEYSPNYEEITIRLILVIGRKAVVVLL